MTSNILTEFKEILGQASWMDAQSKKLADEKVESMRSKIGYPDYILNNTFMEEYYKDVQISSKYIKAVKREF